METTGAASLLVKPTVDDGRRTATEARLTSEPGRVGDAPPVLETGRVMTAAGAPGRGASREAQVAIRARKAIDVHAPRVGPVQVSPVVGVPPVCSFRDGRLQTPAPAAIPRREIPAAPAVAAEGVGADTFPLEPWADGAREIAAAGVEAAGARPDASPIPLPTRDGAEAGSRR